MCELNYDDQYINTLLQLWGSFKQGYTCNSYPNQPYNKTVGIQDYLNATSFYNESVDTFCNSCNMLQSDTNIVFSTPMINNGIPFNIYYRNSDIERNGLPLGQEIGNMELLVINGQYVNFVNQFFDKIQDKSQIKIVPYNDVFKNLDGAPIWPNMYVVFLSVPSCSGLPLPVYRKKNIVEPNEDDDFVLVSSNFDPQELVTVDCPECEYNNFVWDKNY